MCERERVRVRVGEGGGVGLSHLDESCAVCVDSSGQDGWGDEDWGVEERVE